MKGFLLVDKPSGISSFDVIRKLRKILEVKKMGHAGTLDPLASGLLVVAVGEGTKLLEYFIGMDKVYEVEAHFGAVSDSFDADGVISKVSDKEVSLDEIKKVIDAKFVGEIEQVPPKYSALKINGKKAYEMARAGEDFEMKSRRVMIDSFEIIDYQWPLVSFRVACGSGTYIRSLIHDLGGSLGLGAYVSKLRRISVGKFLVQDAVDLDAEAGAFDQKIVSLKEVLDGMPALNLDSDDVIGLSDGKILVGKKVDHDFVFAFYEGKLLGVLENFGDGIKFKKVIK